MNWQAKDHELIWHPYQAHSATPNNRVIVRGQGSLLYDLEGRSYIDAISSWWVNLHGHRSAEQRIGASHFRAAHP